VSTDAPAPLRAPSDTRLRLTRLAATKQAEERMLASLEAELAEIRRRIGLAASVSAALEALSEQLFKELLSVIEDKLSIALQEVLEQDIKLVASAGWRNNRASVDFHIERDGQAEDIQFGQGGSVANILSVGLRMFALTTLDEATHRRVLILDEQDCWLRPDLVPRLVKIVHDAGEALGFQVLMISHHDPNSFREFADKVYRIKSGTEGVTVKELGA